MQSARNMFDLIAEGTLEKSQSLLFLSVAQGDYGGAIQLIETLDKELKQSIEVNLFLRI